MTDTPRYRIKNWSEYQHYKDRNPPWIKLHFALLSSRDWVMLDDKSRVLALASMLIASRSDVPGEFLADSEYFKRVAYLNSEPDFNPLIQCGFLEPLADASKPERMLADARPEERRGETEESESALARPHTKSCFVPADWNPDPILPGQVRIADGVDQEFELANFRLHEFAQPKSNWQNAWLQWLSRAKPPPKTFSDQAADTRKQTVPSSESRHPALVAERQNRPVRVGS